MKSKDIKQTLYDVQTNFFYLFVFITYASYIALAIGVHFLSPKSLNTLDHYAKIYVSLFLLYRFNPFRKIEFNELDRKIAFSAGLFLLTTTFINVVIENYAKAAIRAIGL